MVDGERSDPKWEHTSELDDVAEHIFPPSLANVIDSAGRVYQMLTGWMWEERERAVITGYWSQNCQRVQPSSIRTPPGKGRQDRHHTPPQSTIITPHHSLSPHLLIHKTPASSTPASNSNTTHPNPQPALTPNPAAPLQNPHLPSPTLTTLHYSSLLFTTFHLHYSSPALLFTSTLGATENIMYTQHWKGSDGHEMLVLSGVMEWGGVGWRLECDGTD